MLLQGQGFGIGFPKQPSLLNQSRTGAEAIRQMMAPLPKIRLKPTPVWYNTMIDLAGPVVVRGLVNQRVHRKMWMVIFTCLVSRAVQFYLAEDYSTDSLLLVLVKHEARNGTLSFYYADLGIQNR